MSSSQGNRKRESRARQALVPANPPDLGNLVLQLNLIATELQAAYYTCVTVEAGLMGQDAEQDKDIAFCLRLHVTEAVSRQVERIRSLAQRVADLRPKEASKP